MVANESQSSDQYSEEDTINLEAKIPNDVLWALEKKGLNAWSIYELARGILSRSCSNTDDLSPISERERIAREWDGILTDRGGQDIGEEIRNG